jgi:hypothetical protein
MATPCNANAATQRLNDGWQVVDSGDQWTLQRRLSKPGKPEAWGGRRYHVERGPLLRSIRELCGTVDPDALTPLSQLPERYPTTPVVVVDGNDDEAHKAYIRWACPLLREFNKRRDPPIEDIVKMAKLEREVIARHVEWMSERPVLRQRAA